MKWLRSDTILALIIVSATFFTWKHIGSLQFIGEGYQYFAPWTYTLDTFSIYPHDLFAQVASMVTIPIFKANTSLYMTFTLIIMAISDLLFFAFMRLSSKSRLVSFLAAILFAISFAAKYDMFSNGGYQYFLQRAAILPTLIISLIFLHLYLEKRKTKFLLLSFLVYFASVLLGFFATWFLPFIATYPIIYSITQKIKIKDAPLNFIAPFIYAAVNYALVSTSGFVSDRSFIGFIFGDKNFIPGVLHQLTVLTLPFSKFNQASLLVILIYAFGFNYLYKTNKKFFTIAVSLFIGCIGALSFNVYLNYSAVSGVSDSSRYFYYPYLGVASFWGILLGSLYYHQRKKLTICLISIFMLLLIFNNNYLLKNSLAKHAWNHKANKDALMIVESWSQELKQYPSVVFMPTSSGPYGTTFAHYFFSHPDGQFFEERLHPVDYQELVSLKVDPKRLYVLHFDSVKEVVVDKTEESRAKLITTYASKSPNF